MKKTSSLLFILFISVASFGQTSNAITVPAFNDKYSGLVEQLESGQTDINYKAFRESFIDSEQFRVAATNRKAYDSLKKAMYAQLDKTNYPGVINITKQMLSIDYTSMIAHSVLMYAYQTIGDTANASKYKAIQLGLVTSIVKNGDGKTCATAWPVIQVEEEYFILEMLDAKLNMQSTDFNGGACDKMNVTMDGEKKIFYFDISKVFQGYERLRQ